MSISLATPSNQPGEMMFGKDAESLSQYDLYATPEETSKATWTTYDFYKTTIENTFASNTTSRNTTTDNTASTNSTGETAEPFFPESRVNSAAAFCNDRLYVLGGRLSKTDENQCKELDEKCKDYDKQVPYTDVLDIKTLKWTRHEHHEEPAPHPFRYPSRTMISWKSTLYLFGGESEKNVQPGAQADGHKNRFRMSEVTEGAATLWKCPTTTAIACCGWQKVPPVGKHNIAIVPVPRIGHTALLLENDMFPRHDAGPKMIIFGGRVSNSYNDLPSQLVLSNELWSFDLLSETWQLIDTQGTAPSPRAGHTSVMVGSNMFVYGGIRHFGRHRHGTKTNSHCAALGFSASSPRDAGVGGSGNSASVNSTAELFVFNSKTLAWAPIFYTGLGPGPVFGHVAVVHPWSHDEGKFCVFGGRFAGSKLHPSSIMYCFDSAEGRWHVVATQTNSADEPSGCFGAVAVGVRRSIVLYGGKIGRGCSLNRTQCEIDILRFPDPPCLSTIDDIIARLNQSGGGAGVAGGSVPSSGEVSGDPKKSSVVSYRVDYHSDMTTLVKTRNDDNKGKTLARRPIPFRLPGLNHINRDRDTTKWKNGGNTNQVRSTPPTSIRIRPLLHLLDQQGEQPLRKLLSVSHCSGGESRRTQSTEESVAPHYDPRRTTWTNSNDMGIKLQAMSMSDDNKMSAGSNNSRRNTFTTSPFSMAMDRKGKKGVVTGGPFLGLGSQRRVAESDRVKTGPILLSSKQLRKSPIKL